jgi:hypothetical protein
MAGCFGELWKNWSESIRERVCAIIILLSKREVYQMLIKKDTFVSFCTLVIINHYNITN